MVGGAGRDRVRRTAARARTSSSACLPAVLEPDAETGLDQLDVRAHDPRQQDVADPVVDRRPASRPSSPAPAAPSARAWRRPRRPGGCGWTGRRRSRPGVSAPWASASGTRYSSLRVLLPPNASPELQSSRLAQIRGAAEVLGQPLQRVDRARARTAAGSGGSRSALMVTLLSVIRRGSRVCQFARAASGRRRRRRRRRTAR